MRLFSLLDKKSGSYGGILIAASDGHVGRIVQERFAGSGDTVEKYPSDFDLYDLGEYDTESGLITPCTRFVVNLAVLLPAKEG